MIWTNDAPYRAWLAFMAVSIVLFVIVRQLTKNNYRDVPVGRSPLGNDITLAQALLGFLRVPTAMFLVLLTVGMWAVRIYLGHWDWPDLWLTAFLVLVWPFVEWSIHIGILHARPMTILGFKVHSIFSQIHRAHHHNPDHPAYVSGAPPPAMVLYALILPGLCYLLCRWPRPITASAVIVTMVCRYELWHYLYHTSYRPKSKWFRKLRSHHMCHHFQHEGYWYGVTGTTGDWLFRTKPDPKTTSKSATCRTLATEVEPEREATRG